MRWIEQLFGISPDGGTGLTELLIFVALGVACLLVLRCIGYESRSSESAKITSRGRIFSDSGPQTHHSPRKE